MEKKSMVFYDFDDTFFKRDSMFYLIVYTLKKRPWLFYYLFINLFYFILFCFKAVSFITLKQWIIFPLKYLNDEQLQDFYKTMITPRYYKTTLESFYKHKQEGKEIWLVSASPESYLMMTDLPFDMIIGTSTKPHTNIITSKNCKGEAKVERIEEELKKRGICIDYESSYGYSDSYSDTPMLSLVKHRIKINKKTGEFEVFKVE